MLLLYPMFVAALHMPIRSGGLQRRELLSALPAVATLVVAAPPAAAGSRQMDDVKVLASKARSLRSYVGSTSSNRRLCPMDPDPNVNNYINVAENVERGKSTVLLPLQAAMTTVAAAANLPDAELQKQLEIQPLLMKGHLLELDQAMKERNYEPYTSKTTGVTYQGVAEPGIERQSIATKDRC